jgi:coatomer protein complex subunit alpha (xenin)
MDVTMIHKLEGHERGVNWAQFHPTLNLITSASDDKTIRIWKYSKSTWNEVESLRGHLNNVSCVNFHPKLGFLISNSEDKTLKIWDLQKNSCIETITKENDRFWILATHPNLTLFAAGHDSGFMLFRLESTRVPSCINNNNILF